jgi:hypothetical protein
MLVTQNNEFQQKKVKLDRENENIMIVITKRKILSYYN